MKIYLDNCCFNRPFDDQSQVRIRLESEAKLVIQNEVRSGKIDLVWSYILDYENSKNPFEERKKQIVEWKNISTIHVQSHEKIIKSASQLSHKGLSKYDALHISCAIYSSCDYFLTTDDRVLKKSEFVKEIRIIDPFRLVKELEL